MFAIPTTASFQDLARLVPGRVNKPTEPSNEIIQTTRRRRPLPQQQIVKKIGRIDDSEPESPRSTFDQIPQAPPRRIKTTGQRSRRPRPRKPTTLIESIPVVEKVEPIPTVVTKIVNDDFKTIPFLPVQEPVVIRTKPEPVQPKTKPIKLNKPIRANFPKKFEVIRPAQQNNIANRRKDRIAVVDRYTIQNDDGSFTWGYQSADGSFKEETIGNDCVTRGRQVFLLMTILETFQ